MKSARYWAQWLLAILAALFLSAMWPYIFLRFLQFGSWLLESLGIAHTTHLQQAGVGEMYEALTAVFTLVAFAGVVITLQMQRSDLEQTAQEQKEERKASQIQQFRAEFFQLIKVWQDIIHNTVFGPHKGRQAFHEMSHQLFSRIKGGGTTREPMNAQEIATMYRGFFIDSVSEPLAHYFRLLYNIVKSVDEEPLLTQNEKHDLIRLLRAHLSEPELNLLFWSGLSEYAQNFKPLIDEYDLLQNFLFESVMTEEIRNYPKTFERRQKLGLVGPQSG